MSGPRVCVALAVGAFLAVLVAPVAADECRTYRWAIDRLATVDLVSVVDAVNAANDALQSVGESATDFGSAVGANAVEPLRLVVEAAEEAKNAAREAHILIGKVRVPKSQHEAAVDALKAVRHSYRLSSVAGHEVMYFALCAE